MKFAPTETQSRPRSADQKIGWGCTATANWDMLFNGFSSTSQLNLLNFLTGRFKAVTVCFSVKEAAAGSR
jgi:hypothetical protein